MISYSKLYFLFSTVFLLFIGCGKSEIGHVKISMKNGDLKNAKIVITSPNLLNLDTILLSKMQSDSLGNAILEFDLAKPVFAVITVADQYIPVYVSPGDQLQVEVNTNKNSKSFTYAGDGAKVNNYLKWSGIVKQKYDFMDGKYSFQTEPEQFLIRRDSLQKAYISLFKSLTNDNSISKEVIEVMSVKNKMSLFWFQQNYVSSYYGYGQDINDPVIPESIRKSIQKLPFDTIALQTNIYDYGIILSSYLQSGIYSPIYKKYEKMNPDSISKMLPLIAEREINKGKYPQVLKNFLHAKNIDYCVNMYGLSPELETAHQNFIKVVKEPAYLSTVNKSFNKWLAIGPGKPAPDFTGITANGKKVSLSDLKGKIVYVDVWATWCVPCRGEFPESKKVMKEFEGNNNVAFLFVSIDKDIAAWKKLLPDSSIPNGIHINQVQNQQPGDIWESYHIWGIPRYILINADGNMIQTHAARPSSGKVIDQLHHLNNLLAGK